jgi:hypothetical protein
MGRALPQKGIEYVGDGIQLEGRRWEAFVDPPGWIVDCIDARHFEAAQLIRMKT